VNPLGREEIVSLEDYARLRDAYREAVIAYKSARRLAVGENVTLVFEDRETLRFQVQEMLWIERTREPEKIQLELDVYNELMPGRRSLSATLFIEITESTRIRPELDRLIGIDEHVSLEIGEGAAAQTIRARFDPKQIEEDRISAVQYIRFPLDEAQAERFCDAQTPVFVRVDHPQYRHRVALPPETRASLIRSMSGEMPSLLARAVPKPNHEPRVLFESGRVRAVLPEPEKAPDHVVIEPISAHAATPEPDAELSQELLAAARRVAGDLVRTHGRCRMHADCGGADRGLRWHVYPIAL
jgi:Protein of unknown function (DUF3501)